MSVLRIFGVTKTFTVLASLLSLGAIASAPALGSPMGESFETSQNSTTTTPAGIEPVQLDSTTPRTTSPGTSNTDPSVDIQLSPNTGTTTNTTPTTGTTPSTTPTLTPSTTTGTTPSVDIQLTPNTTPGTTLNTTPGTTTTPEITPSIQIDPADGTVNPGAGVNFPVDQSPESSTGIETTNPQVNTSPSAPTTPVDLSPESSTGTDGSLTTPSTGPQSANPVGAPGFELAQAPTTPAPSPAESMPVEEMQVPGSTPSMNTPGMGTPESSPTAPTSESDPSMTTPASPSSEQAGASNVVDTAATYGNFNTLIQAVEAAGLTETLTGEGPYTVFAPTDEAFAALPTGVLNALLLPENQDLLVQVLTYHVAPGEITSDQIETGAVPVANGGAIAVRVEGDRVIVNDGSVVTPDISASNGVIHAINRVLLPPDVREQLSAQPVQ